MIRQSCAECCVVFNTRQSTILANTRTHFGSGISNRSHGMAHVRWLQMHCQWCPMSDVITRESETEKLKIFKHGGDVDHFGPPCVTTVQGQKIKGHKET